MAVEPVYRHVRRDSVNARPRRIDAVAFDLDGVVWRGFTAVPHAGEVIERIRTAGLRVCFLSNYANKKRSYLCERLADIGIPADPPDVFTSSFLAALHVGSLAVDEREYVTVEDGRTLAEEFRAFGMTAQPLPTYQRHSKSPPCAVVVGYTESFGYEDAARLLRISDHVDGLYATARDRWYAAREGPLPASGWIVAAVEEILSHRALTLGKPNALALRTVADSLSVPVGRILMVGDSAESDVGAARNAGAYSCLFQDPRAVTPVLAGAPRADFEVSDLREITRFLDLPS
ncbi:HAD family hydrolase [Streptomyces sp. NPDC005281]|uniref:HAD-IIA family hydrolase n=1 Tax=Streptomyces sp. NPDC005281 TaxID=3155712 RepID=UPI0033A49BA7